MQQTGLAWWHRHEPVDRHIGEAGQGNGGARLVTGADADTAFVTIDPAQVLPPGQIVARIERHRGRHVGSELAVDPRLD